MADPLCKYFGQCGGCSSQHIDYQMQLDNKKKQLAHSIGVESDSIQVFSDKEYYYRNRMDLIFTPRGIGLRKKGDWRTVIDIDMCVIANERLNELIKEIRQNFQNIDFFDVRKNQGTYRYAVIRTPGNAASSTSSISFVINEDSTKTGDAIDKIRQYAKISTAENIIVTYVPRQTDMSISEEFFVVKGKDMLTENYLDKEFTYSVQGFFQNNTAMAEKMHEYVHELCRKHKSQDLTLLDLYAGVGTFGINNCVFFKKLYIIEADKHCVAAAKINIQKNRIENADIIEMDAMQLKKVDLPDKDLLVITDPPRSGMHPKTIEQLNRLRPKVIIYISCNIEQLGKDLPKFKDYELKSTAMFDLFPHTPHVEAIVELVLK
ncbi:MAG: 23S rRNA (uracil(1939)-C(5))-methyltransferase RlmD [Candidatus Woesearchaeota archaeon]